MPQRLLLLAFLALFAVAPSAAQDGSRSVSGIVTDGSTGEPLPGASVVVKGTSTGTSTDIDGRYELTVPGPDTVLRFTFVGYLPTEETVGSRTSINVTLEPDTRQLDEVVVVGYGSQIQRDVTGNISTVSTEDLETLPVNSFEEAIQGQAAGVFVQNGNGKLGQGIKIQVRGVSSVTADNQPLYVIDGVPVTTTNLSSNGAATNPLSDLAPSDIASIQILKDASAAAIYGARGSNGVVVVETKSGRAGETRFNVNYQVSSSEPTNKVDFMNAEQYVTFYQQAATNSDILSGIQPGAPGGFLDFLNSSFDQLARGTDWRAAADGNPVVDQDWQDLAFQSSYGMKIDVSANGGSEDTQFYISGSYDEQDGILFQDEFDRVSGRLNLDHDLKDWFRIGGRLSLTQTINRRVSNDNAFSTPMQLVAQVPISPLYEPVTQGVNRNQGGYLTEYIPSDDLNTQTEYFNGRLYSDDNFRYETRVFRSLANTYADVQILPELSFRTEFGLDLLDQNEDQFYSSILDQNSGGNDGLGVNVWSRVINYNVNSYGTYSNTFAGVHDLDVTSGINYQDATRDQVFTQGERFPNDSFQQINSAADITDGGGLESNFRFLAYFARANYKFNDRYLLSLSSRIEGSSRFGANNRFGVFPAASAGWIISEEEFLNDSVFSLLKLRASYGLTGNAQIDNFQPLGLFGAARYSGVSGIRPIQLANADLKWEQTAQVNIGIDVGILNDRFSGSVDVYQKNTRDLLLGVNVPGTTGFSTQIRNVGQMENRGIEFAITSNNIVRENFDWSTRVNFGYNQNEVTDLGGQVIEGGSINRAIEGQPLGVFFGLEYAGVDPANGDALYFVNEEDENGNIADPDATTNNPNDANRVVLGSPLPDFTGGMNNSIRYRSFDASVFFQFVYGNEIYDGGGRFKSANGIFFDNQTADQLDAWQEPGDVTDVPQARLFLSNGQEDSDRYLYDGSYLRLRTATLGYTLPGTLSDRLRIDRLRIYVTGNNLLTFTDYKWWDPEVNADYLSDEPGAVGNLSLGNEFYSAPQARSITAGLQFSF